MMYLSGRSRSQRGLLRSTLLLLLAAIISGLLPLAPAPTASAQPRALDGAAPTQALAQPNRVPEAMVAPASAAQQTSLVNVAAGKKATQTNDNPFVRDPYPNTSPAHAVDGNTDGLFGNSSVTTTKGNTQDPNDWWQVDLGGVYPIERVDLWNRTDCCAELLHDVYVLVSDTPFTSNVLSENLALPGVGIYLQSGVLGRTTAVAVGRSGRYVRVVLAQPGPLMLAEVQVWSTQATPSTPGNDPINVAEGRAATQSATGFGGSADRAVDGYVAGNYNAGSVTFAGGSATPDWWQVDLGGIYPIDTIDVWNRTDCCGEFLRDFRVFVSDTPFGSDDPAALAAQPAIGSYLTAGAAGQRTTLAVGRTGRYIRVALTQPGILMLAEVQVWSQRRTPLGAQAAEPTVVAWPRDGEMRLAWFKVAGASSYNVERSDSPAGPFSLIATGIAQPLPGTTVYDYFDRSRANDVFAYYHVTALDAAGRVVNRSDVLKAKPTTTAATSFDAYAPIPATNYTAAYAMREQDDSVLGRPVMSGQANSHYVAFHNVNFGATGPNGVSLRYRASAPGTMTLVAQPSNTVIGTTALTVTNGVWRDENLLIPAVTGVQTVYVFFASQGANSIQLDQLQFSAPGPFDTPTLKWDPNIVLLHKSMGIALDNFLLDQSDMTMLMRFSTTTAQGRAQFAKLKAGSVIASDTNMDLGGPYARVEQVVSLSESEVAVKAAALVFNNLIYAGSFDASAAIQQSLNTAMDAAVGTSAKGPAFSAAGYDTVFPTDVSYYNDSSDFTAGQGGSQARRQPRTAGLGATTAESSTPGIPTSLPPEAKNAPKGTFHITMDNAQFIKDENGWGVEFVNVKMNGLGIQPLSPTPPPGSNPTAAQFGFGVLGGVGAEKLVIQAKVEVNKGKISRNEMFTVKTQVTGKARLQARGLAVALWFWEIPLKWIKPVRFVVPTPVGPIPCSVGFGVQGFVMGVGAGNMNAEKGYQVKLTFGGQPGNPVQVSDFGETKLDFGQKADNTSLFGLFFEPYVKLRVGTFGTEELDPAVLESMIGWMSHWVKITPEQLKKMEGFFVFTFTPRVFYMMLLQNWKDKDRPIHEQKFCVAPIVKAEALPGFPLPITFELRLEGPAYCFWHETWLQYDMKVPDSVLIDPNTGKGKATWGVPIVSERSRIPYEIKTEAGFPYSEPGAPEVLSTNIADAWFNAAERRRCLIFNKPLSALDPINIAYNGPCKPQMTTEVTLPGDRTEGLFILRVLTEYRHPFIPSDAEMIRNEYNGGGGLPWGIWSDKQFQVIRSNDTTTFKVNATEVFSNSAQTMDPIEGTVCDPDALRALGMTLGAQIAVVDPSRTKLVSVTLQLDGADIAANYLRINDALWELQTEPMNLYSGAHTMTIIAGQESFISGQKFVVRYSATFKAQAKSCGRAKPDDLNALVFEGSRCSKQDSPEIPLDVLVNDDWTGEAKLKISAVTPARLGTVRIGSDGQLLYYKPKGIGVDSFVYTAEVSTTEGLSYDKANVLVTNRLATTDAECAGGGGGGGGGSGDGSDGGNGNTKRGRAGGWGEPHMFTADGKGFDSHALGEFTYLRPKPGRRGITIQGRQELYVANNFPAITSALAARVNGHVVEFRGKRTPRVLLDGVAFNGSYIDLGNGASLTVSDNTYTLRGDNAIAYVVIESGGWLNYSFDVPLNDTLEGLLGTPNENPADDLRLPDGTLITGDRPDYFALADGWRISDRSLSLFTYATGEGPETFNKDNPYRDRIPDDTTLAPYKSQARTLLTNTCDSTGITPDERRVGDIALELFIGTPPSAIAMYLCSYEISGRITSTNPAGAPVVGASVELTSSQLSPCKATTDTDGRYRCQLSPIPNTTAAPTVSVTVAGGTTATVAFPTRARISGTLTSTLDLVVTRPSIVLNVRSLDAVTNAPTANTPVQVSSTNSGVQQQVVTGAGGTASVVLTYQPGTTSASLTLTPALPAYGRNVYQNVTLNPTAPVSVTVDVKHIVLGTPAWSYQDRNASAQRIKPLDSGDTPAIAPNGTIYTVAFVSDPATPGRPHRLLATSASGTRLWLSSFAFASQEDTTPLVGPDGTIYVSSQEGTGGRLYAFNPANGALKWTFSPPAGMSSIAPHPALAGDGTVYLLAGPYSGAPTLYAISPATGTPAWTYTLPDGSARADLAVAADGTIYVLGTVLRAVNPNGTLKGATTFSVRSDSRFLIGTDGTVFLTAGPVLEGPGPQTMAINPDLTLRWTLQDVGSWTGGALGTDNALYLPVADYTGNRQGLAKLNPLTGAILWRAGVVPEMAPVVGADGTVYALERSVPGAPVDHYELVGVRVADGAVVTRFKLRAIYALVLKMAPNGRIVVGVNANSGTDLWAVPTSSASGPAAGWSSAWGNAQNTSRRNP